MANYDNGSAMWLVDGTLLIAVGLFIWAIWPDYKEIKKILSNEKQAE